MMIRNAKPSFWIIYKNILLNLYSALVIIFALGCVASGRPLTVRKCGIAKKQISRIVGGENAHDGDYPWMASLQTYYYGFDHICGATVLNVHWIITAAHCISYPTKPWKYEVYVGVHRLSKKEREQSRNYKISKIIVHEDYDDETNYHDIALLRTKEPIDFRNSNGYVNGICLPEPDEEPHGWAITAGWGLTKEGGDEISDILKTVKVPIVPIEFCNTAYHEYESYEDPEMTIPSGTTLFHGHICAGTANMDSCQADSGGPLMQKDKNGVYTLIGVVSFGHGCGRDDYPGVYTKVSYYIDWMENNIQR